METKKISIERTKSGLPALWEAGGGMTNTGYARIITDRSGGPKKPLFIRTRGQLSCNNHALFALHVGDHIIEVSRHGNEATATGWKITNIGENEADVVKVFDVDIWGGYNDFTIDGKYHPQFEEAIRVVRRKSGIYHCREAMYYKK